MAFTKITPEIKKTIPWKLVVIFILFTIGILIVGFFYYKSQRTRIFSEYQNNLSAIASLKIGQIKQWHNERLGDAMAIKGNEPLIMCIKQYFDSKNQTGIKGELLRWMESLDKEYDYDGVSLIDTLFNSRLSFSSSDPVMVEVIKKELIEVIRSKNIILTDLHRVTSVKKPHMYLLVPLLEIIKNKPESFGVVILRIDPQKILFPLIQSWPTPSKSSETLIVRKDGDSVLYLNELRHRQNTSLKFKVPLSNENLLGSKAIHGFEGVVEGVDYRNIAVVGYLTRIAGFPWYMVAKVDKEEILSPLKRYVFLIIIVIVLLILINASIFGFWIWEQRVKQYRKQLKDEITIRESEVKFTTAFQMSPVSITLSSMIDNKFIDVNNTFLNDIEYTREEVIGRTARELNIWADENERQWILNEINEKGRIFGKVISFRSKTGKIIFGLASMSVVKVDRQPCNLSTVVNITESKIAEEKLLKSEELFRKLFENMLNGFAYCKMLYEEGRPPDFVYINVNEAFESLTGLKDVKGKKVSEVIPGIQEADPELLERYSRVALTGNPEVFEIYVESLKMWFSISVYSPQKEYFVAVFDVITDRKLGEVALLKSEERFRSLYENVTIGIYRTTIDGCILMANPALVNMLGFDSFEQLAQRNLEKEGYEPDYPRSKFLETMEKQGKIIGLESAWNEKNGKALFIRESASAVRDSNGRILYYDGTVEDITDRKLAEEALQKSEKKYRNLFEKSQVGMFRTRIDGSEVLEVNDKLCEIIGFTREEMIGNPSSIRYSDNKRRSELITSLKKNGTLNNFEIGITAKDGSIKTVIMSLTSYPEEGILEGSFVDITDRKKVEEALQESEDKFKYVFDHSVIGKSLTLPSGEIHVNKTFCDMLGYKQEELEKTKWQDISHPDDIKATEEMIRSLLSCEKDTARFIKRYLHKNGGIVWTDVGTALRRDPEGKPLYFMTAINDITERKRAEESLRESERRLREAQEMAHLGFWFWDIKTGYVEWSDEVYKIFWLDPKEFTPQIDSILALSPWEEDNQRDKELIDRALKSHSPGSYEQKFLRPDKSIGYYYSTFQGNYDEKGDIISIVGTVLDITERKIAESQIKRLNEELEQRVTQRTEQLQAVNKELEAFSYSVSHDLRAPLRSVHGYSKILMEEYEDKLDEEGKRVCGIISSSATQMGELIDDLLSFSRIGRSNINLSLLDMKSMIGSVYEDITSDEEKSRSKLKIGKLQKAFGDANLIRLVWNNLISNAIKYSSKATSSEISISSRQDDHQIIYSIKDNGVGFDMEYKHKLFGVFQRLHSESEFEGNGVGLAIVQRIVLRHGGKVWAEGEVGKGATFYFSLPVQDINKKTHDTRHTTHA